MNFFLKPSIIILFIIILFIPFKSYSQQWILSNHLQAEEDIRIFDIKKDKNDNFFLTGVFNGTVDEKPTKGSYDIFLAKFNPLFEIQLSNSLEQGPTFQ